MCRRRLPSTAGRNRPHHARGGVRAVYNHSIGRRSCRFLAFSRSRPAAQAGRQFISTGAGQEHLNRLSSEPIARATARLPSRHELDHDAPLDGNLPDPLPADPLELAAQWLAQARIDAAQPNPNSMVLATVDHRGRPSARVVLCKEIECARRVHHLLYELSSRKGRELRENPRAAVVFHWDHRHRQVRAEGQVELLSDAENDAYFMSRPWQSRLGAWASRQSEPVASRSALASAVSTRPRVVSTCPTPVRAARSRTVCGAKFRGRRTGAAIG